MAPVRRELVLLPSDQKLQTSKVAPGDADGGKVRTSITTTTTIDNLPANFSGRLTMYPEYVVGVSVKLSDDETKASSAKFSGKTMVPLSTEIRLQARESDYVYIEWIQHPLPQLIAMPPNCLPRTVRIVGWNEVGGSVHNKFPGKQTGLTYSHTVAGDISCRMDHTSVIRIPKQIPAKNDFDA